MSRTVIIVAFIALAILAAGVGAYVLPRYHRLVALRLDVGRAWSELERLLSWRHDEIQRLATIVQAVGCDPDVATDISARFVAIAPWLTPPERYVAEQRINASASKLLNLISFHPNLRRNQRFIDLRQRINALDEQIQGRREHYNALIAIVNVYCEESPDRFLAARAGLT